MVRNARPRLSGVETKNDISNPVALPRLARAINSKPVAWARKTPRVEAAAAGVSIGYRLPFPGRGLNCMGVFRISMATLSVPTRTVCP